MRLGAPRADGPPRSATTPFPVKMMIAAALLAMLAAGCSSTPGHSPGLTATRQVRVAPVSADGTPAGGFRTTVTASHATCEPGSEAIGQAYRCFAGNGVYDPCWAEKAAAPTVLCMPDPWSVTDARLSVSTALSAIPNEGGISEPWGVELSAGQRCVLLQGAHGEFDGQVIDYYCSPKLLLLRGLTESGPIWRARSVIEKSGKSWLGPSEEISLAWFGRPDTFR